MANACTIAFAVAMKDPTSVAASLEGLSDAPTMRSIMDPAEPSSEVTQEGGHLLCLLKHGAIPKPKHLFELSRQCRIEHLNGLFLGAVSRAHNPFVPGMILSVALANAAMRAPEREQRTFCMLRDRVDELLLEILERLPQTTRGFTGGVKTCEGILEPEAVTSAPSTFLGPLQMALKERQQTETFVTTPLFQEYLATKFVSGLPSMLDTNGSAALALRDATYINIREPSLYDMGFVADGVGGRYMQGDRHRKIINATTILPGAQFALVGMVAKPCRYYEMPVLRMMFDIVVYLGVLVLYSIVVLQPVEEPASAYDFAFAFYIAVSTRWQAWRTYNTSAPCDARCVAMFLLGGLRVHAPRSDKQHLHITHSSRCNKRRMHGGSQYSV